MLFYRSEKRRNRQLGEKILELESLKDANTVKEMSLSKQIVDLTHLNYTLEKRIDSKDEMIDRMSEERRQLELKANFGIESGDFKNPERRGSNGAFNTLFF